MLPFALPASRGYVVALSGGADSRLLLELTVRAVLARGGDPGAEVRAAHMNHGIRGTEADRDEAFCRTACETLGVPLTVERADIPAMARESGQSEETAARIARYAFLVRVTRESGFPTLLTAHNADDQLETLLFHLLRGSGTRGMIGIPAMRPLGDTLPNGTPLTVCRPLLGWSRRDVLNGIRELGLTYVTDSTNLADICTRNRLRHGVIPALEEISAPGVPQESAVRLGRAAEEDEDALMSIAATRYEAAVADSGLPAAAVAAELPAIAKRMLRMAYAAYLGGTPTPDRTLSAYNLDDLLGLCRDGRDRSVSDTLPGHIRAELRAGRLCFAPCTPKDRAAAMSPLPLRPLTEELTVWDKESPRITIEIKLVDATAPLPVAPGVLASAIFPPTLISSLAARSRASGDTIYSHGMTKKLKKVICEKHVSLDLRDRLPLICLSDGTPLWFPGVAFRDGFLPPAAGPAVRVTVRMDRESHG